MLIAAITAVVLFFASGSNRACDLRGLSDVGMAAGIALPETTEETLVEIETRYSRTGLPLFVDSGAFSEVKFGAAGPYVVAPITHEDWLAKLATYQRIATAMGPQAYLVAPDKVGFPADTLDRLRRYRSQVQALAATGAKILIAMQGPKDALADFCQEALDAAGLRLDQVVIAFPCCKNATKAEDLDLFLQDVQPAAIHLLGLGPKAKELAKMIKVAGQLAPACKVSHDACYIRRHVGHLDKAKTRKAPLTAAKHAWQDEADGMLWGTFEADEDAMGDIYGDWTDQIADPCWLSPAALTRVAGKLALDPQAKRRWKADPAAWLQEGDEIANYELPWVEGALNQEWKAYRDAAIAREKQRRGIVAAFGPDTDLNVPAPAQYCAANTPADTVRRAPRHSHTTRTAPVQLPLFA